MRGSRRSIPWTATWRRSAVLRPFRALWRDDLADEVHGGRHVRAARGRHGLAAGRHASGSTYLEGSARQAFRLAWWLYRRPAAGAGSDAVRTYAAGFTFTTALPPAICAAAAAAIRHLNTSRFERDAPPDRGRPTKLAVLVAAGLPVRPNETQIVPVFVGNPEKFQERLTSCSRSTASTSTINYPTVPRAPKSAGASPLSRLSRRNALIEGLVLSRWLDLGPPSSCPPRGKHAMAAE